MTPAEVLPHLRRLVAAYPAMRWRNDAHIKEALTVYAEEIAHHLGGYSDPADVLADAIGRTIRACKFWPTVAELIEHVDAARTAAYDQLRRRLQLEEDTRRAAEHRQLRAAFDAEQTKLLTDGTRAEPLNANELEREFRRWSHRNAEPSW